MISLIVPTRNRAHALRLVAASFFEQAGVDEIIVVDDAGDDDTGAVIAELAARHPRIRARVLRNPARLGAAQSRNRGVAAASNPYVLFCDDDEYLERDYALTCHEKLIDYDAGAVSGRRIYLEPDESIAAALRRFGHGLRNAAPFRKLICEYVNAARFSGDLQVPLTNAVILTRRDLLLRFPFDEHYARGNGYREESDYQMSLFVNGYATYVTNDCHSFHLPFARIRSGGQRKGALARLYWSTRYTGYFYRKHYAAYARRVGLRLPRSVALLGFACFALYRETLRPPLYALVKWWLRRQVAKNHAVSTAE
jgi:glycosyltransferase involved in cell wall biosynthesis